MKKPINWRAFPDAPDADDTELERTPQDVIAVLGFDPKEADGSVQASEAGEGAGSVVMAVQVGAVFMRALCRAAPGFPNARGIWYPK